MNASAEIISAWLLHSRPFRDTSMLLDFFTLQHGKVSAVARGVRSSKNRGRSLLQPFIPLSIVLVGKHELQTLKSFESSAPSCQLNGEQMFAGLYMNELMIRLLPMHEPEILLFKNYSATLHGLEQGSETEILLRRFELQLLDCLGYGLHFDQDAGSGEAINDESWYYLHADNGFVRQLQLPGEEIACEQAGLIPGSVLQSLARDDFSSARTRRFAKKLMRQILQHHLGGREIFSRQLFAGKKARN